MEAFCALFIIDTLFILCSIKFLAYIISGKNNYSNIWRRKVTNHDDHCRPVCPKTTEVNFCNWKALRKSLILTKFAF